MQSQLEYEELLKWEEMLNNRLQPYETIAVLARLHQLEAAMRITFQAADDNESSAGGGFFDNSDKIVKVVGQWSLDTCTLQIKRQFELEVANPKNQWQL